MPTYFTITSSLNGMALDIEGNNVSSGTKVITYGSTEQDNQLWYHDIYDGVIRSKCNHDYVLDIEDGEGDLVINQYNGSDSQKFGCGGDTIYKLHDDGQVLDIADNNEDECARVCVWNHNGGANQCWTLNQQERAYFMIKSDMSGLVLDIDGGNTDAGTEVITWSENGADNQLWYEDEHNVIRSKLNDYVIDSSSGDLIMSPFYKENEGQGFSFDGNKIINLNDKDQCVDIKDHNSDEGARLCQWGYKGSDNQHFTKEYV